MPVCQLCAEPVAAVSGRELFCSNCWSLLDAIGLLPIQLRVHNTSLEVLVAAGRWVKLGHLGDLYSAKNKADGVAHTATTAICRLQTKWHRLGSKAKPQYGIDQNCEICGNPRGTGGRSCPECTSLVSYEIELGRDDGC